jgi:phospholipid-binding lipoprotein MlaA
MKTRALLAAVVLALLAGCATGPNANPADPFEPLNRKVFAVNDALDDAVVRPVATAYRRVLPSPVRQGVTNFFGNLSDVWSFFNNVMQLKLQASAETFMRVNVNTVFGLGGLLDIGTEVGLARHTEDFGQTLGYWGVPAGPYLVLPILGPSTVRDGAALFLVDYRGDPVHYVDNIPLRNSLYALRLVDIRSNLLRLSQLLGDAALDKYTFTRDVFLQKRLSDIHDGKVPGDGN